VILIDRAVVAPLEVDQPGVDAVVTALQLAIELEHATIPPYLYALYSLDPQKNAVVAGIIESVVIEEMRHLTLAANVVNALGADPEIGRAGFVPRYPTTLPGGVEAGLVVHLAPFSLDQLQAFLAIEEPENPLVYPPGPDADAPVTIGGFYRTIIAALAKLPPGSFVEPARHQIGPDLLREAVVVENFATARTALTQIIDQGEGTATSPEEQVGTDVAHYYRFMQIAKGHLLVKNPDPPPGWPAYSYRGAPVPFDPTGVYAVPADPTAAAYPPGSQARIQFDQFNQDYSALLAQLHAFCTGQNTKPVFDAVLGQMMSLRSQAVGMMSGVTTDPSVCVGPSFEATPAP
jgi:hypothetical protein